MLTNYFYKVRVEYWFTQILFDFFNNIQLFTNIVV